MPLYEYQCKKCRHRFERILLSYSADDVKECPVCGGEVERLLSAPAVQFKGSGFYSTDYAARPGTSAQPSNDGAAKPASSDGASGDSGSKAPEKNAPANTEPAPKAKNSEAAS
jgi:putative FmdB family regulatory protein